jgi:hypothetical protein
MEGSATVNAIPITKSALIKLDYFTSKIDHNRLATILYTMFNYDRNKNNNNQ